MKDDKLHTQSLIKTVLTTEVKYLLGIVAFVAGVVAPYYDIRQDIALIKENHFTHMEAMQREILGLQTDQAKNDERYVELLNLIYNNK